MYDDQKIKRLRRIHGITGYGLWCFMLEQVGKEGMKCRLPREYSPDIIGIDVNLPTEKVLKILTTMAEIGLIHKQLYEKENIVCVPQFSRYYDEYHAKLRKKWQVGTTSGQCRDKVRRMAYNIDREINTSDPNYIKDDNDSIRLIELAQKDPELAKSLEKIGIIKTKK